MTAHCGLDELTMTPMAKLDQAVLVEPHPWNVARFRGVDDGSCAWPEFVAVNDFDHLCDALLKRVGAVVNEGLNIVDRDFKQAPHAALRFILHSYFIDSRGDRLYGFSAVNGDTRAVGEFEA